MSALLIHIFDSERLSPSETSAGLHDLTALLPRFHTHYCEASIGFALQVEKVIAPTPLPGESKVNNLSAGYLTQKMLSIRAPFLRSLNSPLRSSSRIHLILNDCLCSAAEIATVVFAHFLLPALPMSAAPWGLSHFVWRSIQRFPFADRRQIYRAAAAVAERIPALRIANAAVAGKAPGSAVV
jgi:hypothetical protein